MRTWIMPANSDKYNHKAAFERWGYIDWKKHPNTTFAVGDIVYLYSSGKDKQIRYKTRVEKINIPIEEKTDDSLYWYDENIKSTTGPFVRLKLLTEVNNKALSYSQLKTHGVNSTLERPVTITGTLLNYIETQFGESPKELSRKELLDYSRTEPIKKLERISIDDNYVFTRDEAMARCFSPYKIGQVQATAETGDGCRAWFPKAQYKDKYGNICSGSQTTFWKNYFEKDQDIIIMWLEEGEPATDTGSEPKMSNVATPLHCFWSKDHNSSYKYVGTYLHDLNASIRRHVIFRRIKSEIDLSQWCYHDGDFAYIDRKKEGFDVYKNLYIKNNYKKQKKYVDSFINDLLPQLIKEDKEYINTCDKLNKLKISDHIDFIRSKLPSYDFVQNGIEYDTLGRFLMDVIALKDDIENLHNGLIRKCGFDHLLAGKVLSLYYPRFFLYSLSEEETDFYLDKLGLKTHPGDDITEKHCLLYFWKQFNIAMDDWSPFIFYKFLQYVFGEYKTTTPFTYAPVSNKTLFDEPKKAQEPTFGNIAIKCTYCDGGKNASHIGFAGVCSDEMITNNIENEHRVWCCDKKCPCSQYHNNQINRAQLEEIMMSKSDLVCYESTMLTQWTAQAGLFENGRTKRFGEGIHEGSVCVFTTRTPDSAEKDRFIFGMFIVDELFNGDDNKSGYVKCNTKYKLELNEEETGLFNFWDYFRNKNNPEKEAWGTGLYRYLSDEAIIKILKDLIVIRDGKNKHEVQRFLSKFVYDNKLEGLVSNSDLIPSGDLVALEEINTVTKEETKQSELAEYAILDSIDKLAETNGLDDEYSYTPIPEERKEVNLTSPGHVSVYPRDPQRRINALERANFKCEYNAQHPSFTSRSTNRPYMETHHLIPLEYWTLFDNSIDVEANIICLCSNCHNEIHYGKNANSLIKLLYSKRKGELIQAGINISLAQLYAMYSHSGNIAKSE